MPKPHEIIGVSLSDGYLLVKDSYEKKLAALDTKFNRLYKFNGADDELSKVEADIMAFNQAWKAMSSEYRWNLYVKSESQDGVKQDSNSTVSTTSANNNAVTPSPIV